MLKQTREMLLVEVKLDQHYLVIHMEFLSAPFTTVLKYIFPLFSFFLFSLPGGISSPFSLSGLFKQNDLSLLQWEWMDQVGHLREVRSLLLCTWPLLHYNVHQPSGVTPLAWGPKQVSALPACLPTRPVGWRVFFLNR